MENPEKALDSLDIQAFLSSRDHEMSDFITDLSRINAGEEVFGPNRHSRILFLENPGTAIGHFTLLSQFESHLEWFDPRAGYPPEEVFELSRRLNLPLQTLAKGSPLQGPKTYTCGKWCILRYYSLPTSLADFCEIFKNLGGDIVVDKLINLKVTK